MQRAGAAVGADSSSAMALAPQRGSAGRQSSGPSRQQAHGGGCGDDSPAASTQGSVPSTQVVRPLSPSPSQQSYSQGGSPLNCD